MAGVTVPTGVASISAPPVRNLPESQPSLLGAYPGLPHTQPARVCIAGHRKAPMTLRDSDPLQPSFQEFQMQQQLLQPKKLPQPTGPMITVFVGNITERAPDMLVRQLLSVSISSHSHANESLTFASTEMWHRKQLEAGSRSQRQVAGVRFL